MGSNDPAGKSGSSRKWKANHNSLSWSSGPTESMRDAIAGITNAGGGVMFSRTIDGSALIIGVYSGNDRTKEYITELGDITPCLAWLLETYG